MNKKIFNRIILICCLISVLCVGCKKDADEARWNAVVNISLDNLPKEYKDLPEAVREDVRFYVHILEPSKDKDYCVCLERDNKYKDKANVLPGEYKIDSVTVSGGALGDFEATISEKAFVIGKNSEVNLTVSVANPENIGKRIQKNKESQEILNADLYSRKIQYNGNIYDMKSLPELIHFNYPSDTILEDGEEMEIGAEGDVGVSMIIKNTSEGESLPPEQCECIGFKFFNIRTVLPKGIKLGLPIDKIVNAKTGIAKTPDYCIGAPILGMGFKDTTLVYIDGISGDRISIFIHCASHEVNAIYYEFNRYE